MKKTLSETVLYKLVGTFSMKDLQHSTPDLTFLKERKKNKKDKKEETKKRKKQKDEGAGKSLTKTKN